jgi:glucose-1-phosphate cytidylyltransferase
MKVVLLAGGRGTRIAEETEVLPKPMVEIGGRPIIWHIMKIFSHYGFNDFIICLGYKGYVIKEYFYHYFMHMSDVTIDLSKHKTTVHSTSSEPWKITLVDTGLETMTGSRLRRIKKYLGKQPFLMSYGDSLADVNIKKLVQFHKAHKKMATVTVVQNAGRFGVVNLGNGSKVSSFLEKPEDGWINGGFFVLQPQVIDLIDNDDTVVWEKGPLEKLSKKGELYAYRHSSFWGCMDTLRDKISFERIWQSGQVPWRVW